MRWWCLFLLSFALPLSFHPQLLMRLFLDKK
jgi:hypothetical protein